MEEVTEMEIDLLDQNRKRTLEDPNEILEPLAKQPNIDRCDSHYGQQSGASSSGDRRSVISVTDTMGNVCFLSVNKSKDVLSKQEILLKSCSFQLNQTPFDDLKKTVEDIRYRKIMENTDSMLYELRQNEYSMDLLNDPLDAAMEEENSTKPMKSLWADKYSPKTFTELLSDDGVNRSLLSWLKLWDESVFGSSCLLKDTSNQQPNQKRRQQQQQQQQKQTNKKQFPSKYKNNQWDIQNPLTFATNEALDENRRPIQKIVLLYGPPGIGKTTLAHIVAAQCGYNVVEINASDDRSPETFRKVLESSTEMRSVLALSGKPNCLIIDEIDGAPAAAINVLIDIAKAKPTTSKKKQKKSSLSRPVLCICNDLYAPSLHGLRSYAIVIQVPSTITSKLSTRLIDICHKEGLSSNTSTMMALCEKADNDIRTCLNTLQFIHRKSSDLTLSAVQAVALGQKDSHKSVLTFLREVFKLPTPKQFTHNRSELEAKENITSLRYYYMLMESSRTGEYDKVLQGLFENYLSVKIRDPNMEIVAEVQDWILFQESLSTIIYGSQEYQFMSYLPFTSIIFHFFYAVTSGQRTIQYPRTQYEITQKHQRSKQLVSQIASESQPSVLRDIDRQMSSVYFVPLLLNIITPNLRPVNVQLYTKWEKGLLKMIVSTMVAYNLTYKQDRGPDGQYTYLLDPELDELCGYTGLPQKRQLQYVTKQLLAREIGQAKVKHEAKSDSSLAIKERINPKSLPAVNVSKSRNKRQRNFFGQPLVNKEPPLTSETNNPSVKAVWFKFNEGFSDAVKKPIKIQDLL